MFLRKPSSFVLGLFVTTLLASMTVGVAGGDDHLITDEYITVDPDGYWNAQVAAGGHQQWSFELAEPRDHNIGIAIVEPEGASLSVSMNGEDLGSAGVEDGLFSISLAAGSHAVTISNSGGAPVHYNMYMGIADPVAAINALLDVIDVLVQAGTLKTGQANGLTRPLDNALRSPDKEKPDDACNQLGDFISKVEAKKPTPLPVGTANGLIDSAVAILESLECAPGD